MKRMVSMLLCCALLLSVLPTAVGAAGISGRHPAEAVVCNSASYGAAGGEASPRAFAYKTMKSSDKLLSLIMDCEGFSATPYWDYSQWTIGYGTFCGYTRAEVPAEYWSGISRAKGKELLVDYMRKHAEAEVNRFFKGLGRQPLQQQFDAVVDFTYALGSSWMYEDSRIKAWLKKPTTDLELMRAMGAWCRVDGKVNTDTCDRRIREALIYLDGLYLLPHGTVGGGLATVPKGKLPVFRYVVYQGNGTAINGSRTDDVNYYLEGGSYDTVLTPARSGYVFGGWQRSDGSLLLPGQPVKENLTVRAKWTNHPFRDVPKNAWYSLPVAYCYDNGIMNGAYATKFLPDGAASRAMAVTVLYRMAGEPKVSGTSGLGDVAKNQYYTNAVTWAVQKGIVTGYKDGTFRPDRSISRAEMVTFLYRYAKNVRKADVSAPNQLFRYVDGGAVEGYARDPFNWAIDKGLISSTSTTKMQLSPNATATRCQLAKQLMYLDNLR